MHGAGEASVLLWTKKTEAGGWDGPGNGRTSPAEESSYTWEQANSYWATQSQRDGDPPPACPPTSYV